MGMEVTPHIVTKPSLSDVPARSPWKSLRPLLPWLALSFSGLLLTASSLLWRIWTNDALRSIGIYFPIVSVILTLRVWRKLHWESRGTWWGLLPLYYAAVMAREGGGALQLVAFTKSVGFTLLPLGLTVFAYGSGVVLLLGGARVWRAALFPLALLLFVNPVPGAFQLIDLPLQFFCSRVAQHFALAIGVHPDVNQLRLMFAPGFGMFIAPGCDGIRGAVTMGYLALVLAYLYNFSVAARFLSTASALALGYVFNLIRLCALVIFYRIALRFPSLQPHGTSADYVIGGFLFLIAAALFACIVRWKKQNKPTASLTSISLARGSNLKNTSLYWKGAVASLLVLVSSFSSVRALAGMARSKMPDDASDLAVQTLLPQHMGKYRLQRVWSEQDWLSHLAYRWAAYLDDSSGSEIDMALWLGPGVHYPIACHVSRGERPSWQQVSTLPTARDDSATFALYFYEEPIGQTLEATTICDARGCNEQAILPSQTGIAFASMGLESFLFHPTATPLPVIIRAQSHDLSSSAEDDRRRMLREIQDFISQLDTPALARFSESRNR